MRHMKKIESRSRKLKASDFTFCAVFMVICFFVNGIFGYLPAILEAGSLMFLKTNAPAIPNLAAGTFLYGLWIFWWIVYMFDMDFEKKRKHISVWFFFLMSSAGYITGMISMMN